jgi:magnesium-transporting ATPase (P-type)
LQQYGHNRIRKAKGPSLLLKCLANFTHLMALLLWLGGAIAMFAHLPQLGLAIWLVNLLNGAFSFWQEFKAEKATEALRRLLPIAANVCRAGEVRSIAADDLVPGDILVLAEGVRISADCRVVDTSELYVDQSTLTGKRMPCTKQQRPCRRLTWLTPNCPTWYSPGPMWWRAQEKPWSGPLVCRRRLARSPT